MLQIYAASMMTATRLDAVPPVQAHPRKTRCRHFRHPALLAALLGATLVFGHTGNWLA